MIDPATHPIVIPAIAPPLNPELLSLDDKSDGADVGSVVGRGFAVGAVVGLDGADVRSVVGRGFAVGAVVGLDGADVGSLVGRGFAVGAVVGLDGADVGSVVGRGFAVGAAVGTDAEVGRVTVSPPANVTAAWAIARPSSEVLVSTVMEV
jgi:ribosomal protein L30E